MAVSIVCGVVRIEIPQIRIRGDQQEVTRCGRRDVSVTAVVVAGHGLIQQRKIGTDEILDFEVSGENIQAVQMLPGYTHSIVNLSETENLVTVMWANEIFNADRPDTFREEV